MGIFTKRDPFEGVASGNEPRFAWLKPAKKTEKAAKQTGPMVKQTADKSRSAWTSDNGQAVRQEVRSTALLAWDFKKGTGKKW